MNKVHENMVQITLTTTYWIIEKGFSFCDSTTFSQMVWDWANEFEGIEYWKEEICYLEAIDKFTYGKLKKYHEDEDLERIGIEIKKVA